MASTDIEKSKFLNSAIAKGIKAEYGTPVYVYDKASLVSQASKALQFPNLYGLKVRFAMKACPNAAVLQLFSSMGICFDASSGYEVLRLVRAGVPASNISLSSQELPVDLKELIDMGVEFNACSLHQLRSFGQLFPGGKCGVRFNPGTGSGGNGKTNVGGPTASFGIWHELMGEVQSIVAEHSLQVERVHTHIGSGSDPEIWQNVALLSLNLVKQFPSVTTLNLGGGYKVGRMSYEKSTDLSLVGEPVVQAFKAFAEETGREIKLEIEPGTFLVANAGALLSTVQDVMTTGAEGHTFLKLDSGMTEVLRPSLYGAQHPLVIHSDSPTTSSYVVVGHCCESGDLFTCAPSDPEVISERLMATAAIGDLISIEGSGAYCSSMSTKNYNSFPEAPEVMLDTDGQVHLIRRRQTVEHMLENEVPFTA
ncbi:diaminopimelate decarboxylase [Ochromonadaceae sp. CCMP2298]|nr:diaminopimelate decarboxylase [Ochromonadaceae sp. CCMP2298]|eukprot:CAMPEP_0173203250 /NCGR_PEP_ID=MMETSP1141-20130122/19417_1 /TAXON_ID=483371 /ORGANISM="non described non described, Strain CCMP2298" /LENGTH=422 /DNA_ID=CAMNT_0014128691 /DNA_START=55 /DNA_END=1323 /DNA_ORIENTATION=+